VASILIVEDDDTLRMTLADNLVDEGYEVREAGSVSAARDACAQGAPDLVLLDIMLPDGDGYSLCRELREGGYRGMVMMLTARTLEDDLIKGFDAGADDYLKKPYKLAELLVRTKALMRRAGATLQEAPDEEQLDLDGHRIDRGARRVVTADDDEVKLTRTEYDLLLFFVDNAGRALSRDEILDEVWGKDVVVDFRTVDNFVSSLKKKLGHHSKSAWAIATIRGVGYRFEVRA
jgi:two-component system OmpR family response regulator